MSVWVWLALAGAGAAGAVLRYTVDAAIASRSSVVLPLGTLVINLTGSLVLGAVTGLALFHAFPATPKLLIGTGACGAYTTFSTMAFESVVLARGGGRLPAVVNVGANVVGSCLAAAAGLALAAV